MVRREDSGKGRQDGADEGAALGPSVAALPVWELSGAVGRVVRRLRFSAGASAVVARAPAVVALSALPVALARFWPGHDLLALTAAGAALAGLLGIFVSGWRRGPGQMSAALTLDRALGREGALATAFELQGRERELSGFEQLLLSRERERATNWEVPKLVPLRVPAGSTLAFGLVGLFLVLSVIPIHRPVSPVSAPAPADLAPEVEGLSVDQAELLAEAAAALKASVDSDAGRAEAEKVEKVIEDVAAGRMAPSQALLELSRLADEIEDASRQSSALAEELKARGEALSADKTTKELGRALTEMRRKDAAEALRKLSERLSSGEKPLSDKELSELRQSLDKAREVSKARAAQPNAEETAQTKALKDKRERLLQKKASGAATAEDKAELERTERQLETLERRKKAAEREVSELDRLLAEAAQELSKERKKAGEFMDQAAQTMEEAAGRELTDEDKKKLIEELKKLKERLREERQGESQKDRLEEFQRRARGQRGQDGQQGQEGSQSARGAPRPLPIPVPGGSSTQGKPGSPGSEGKQDTNGSGSKPGTAHNPDVEGAETKGEHGAKADVSAVAQDSGQGPTASETILGAADEGFSAVSYEKLFVDYKTVLEELMEKETLPPGRRRQIERYFELIRPRGVSPSREKSGETQ